MLNANDIALLRGMFVENNEVFGRQLKREMRDEIHSVVNAAVFASEERLMKEIQVIHQEISDVKDAVIDLVDDNILPKIEEHSREIAAIKRQMRFV